MNNIRKSLVSLSLALVLVGVLSKVNVVQAVTGACTDYSCPACPGEEKIDLVCQRAKFTNPQTNCTVLYCPGSNPSSNGTVNATTIVNFFGVTIHVDDDKRVVQLIYVAFSAFLGLVAVVLVILGIVSAYKVAQAEKAGDISYARQTLTNAVIGFIIIVFSLGLVQIVASVLGIGSLDKLVDFSCVFSQSATCSAATK